MTPRRIILIGPSGAGKTTVGRILATQLNVAFLSMDEFRAHGTHSRFYAEHRGEMIRNYEDPKAWDANAILCKLRALIYAGHGFIVEGNHLLRYPEIAALDAERYYLDVPFQVSAKRRVQRGRGNEADRCFALIGEQQTKLVVEPQLQMPNVTRLDGLRQPNDNAQRILAMEAVGR